LLDPILTRVANGDCAAVQECLDRYGGLVWSLARRLCLDATDVEDAVQEIFVDLWKSADRFNESIASEPTFVAMIARRRLIDRRRKRMRSPEDAAGFPEASVPAAAVDVDHASVSDEAARAAAAMKQLRPEQQQVLALAIHYGRTFEQIAQILGMPLGTVKTHARRGLIRLRELLDASRVSHGHPRGAGSDAVEAPS
jgi:RNA polymerase sigma-70 factor (ECF subfamily)